MNDFKRIVKNNYWGNLAISYFHCIEAFILPKLISDEKAVKRYYKKRTGKDLNLDNPKTFSEKMNWYKLNERNLLMQQCADKVAVRNYVEDCGYSNILNDIYGVYDSVDSIDINKLPDQFVLKAAHGSHMQYIVKDKNAFDWKRAKRMMQSWLRQNIYWSGREWPYKNMPRRIIAEKYIEDETGELRDFKFFCFNGEPEFLQYDVGRFDNEHIRNYYDMTLNRMDITDNETVSKDIGRPISVDQFEKMKAIARALSKPFQFVRTDFYQIGDRIVFGELTFFDGGGYSGFTKEADDKLFGDKWKLEKNE